MAIVDKYGLQQAADNWQPEFEYVDSIEEAVNLINLPHEDYPFFCQATHNTLCVAIEMLKDSDLREFDIKALHGLCMKEKEHIIVGDYRTQYGTMVGSFEPPHPMYIGQLMMGIFPISKDEKDIEMWYRIFECIHPFEDGNGRIGGVVLAAVSFIQEGRYKVPKRSKKEVLKVVETNHVFGDGCLYKLNQPAIIFEKGLEEKDNKYKRSFFNQVEGTFCRQRSFDGVMYALPYQFTLKKPFDPIWWSVINWSKMTKEDQTEEFITGTIKKIEKILIKHTDIEYIKIDERDFTEASAYCEVIIYGQKMNAWLTWENCD